MGGHYITTAITCRMRQTGRNEQTEYDCTNKNNNEVNKKIIKKYPRQRQYRLPDFMFHKVRDWHVLMRNHGTLFNRPDFMFLEHVLWYSLRYSKLSIGRCWLNLSVCMSAHFSRTSKTRATCSFLQRFARKYDSQQLILPEQRRVFIIMMKCRTQSIYHDL